MSSPSKITKESLLRSHDIQNKPLNYERYRDIENELEKENLIEFIKHSCMEQKQQLKESLDNLVNEKERTNALVKHLERAVQRKEKKLQKLGTREEKEKRRKYLAEENERIQIQIANHNQALLAMKGPIKEFEDHFNDSKREIQPDTIKRLYTYLEKKNNQALIFVVEALVGLLRNERRSNPVSVELYTKKYDGFIIGLNRADPKTMNPNWCQENLELLQNQYNEEFETNPELKIFKPIRACFEKLCELAIKEKDVVINEKQIEEKEAQIEVNQREYDTIKVFLDNDEVLNVINKDLDFLKYTELRIAKEKEAKLTEQISKMRYQYDNFEDIYFADL